MESETRSVCSYRQSAAGVGPSSSSHQAKDSVGDTLVAYYLGYVNILAVKSPRKRKKKKKKNRRIENVPHLGQASSAGRKYIRSMLILPSPIRPTLTDSRSTLLVRVYINTSVVILARINSAYSWQDTVTCVSFNWRCPWLWFESHDCPSLLQR